MTDFDNDDETRRLLGAADPARSLAPVDADALAPILEDTMSQSPTEQGAQDRRSNAKTRLVLLGGAAAAVLAIAVGVGIASSGDDKGTPGAGSTTAGTPTVTSLSAGPASSARCAPPSAKFVAHQDVAFEGTVTGIADGVVSFSPTHFFHGTATDVVTVAEPDLGMSEMPVDFQVGKAYIVGATDGQVSICGLSGLATDELRALYVQAFGG